MGDRFLQNRDPSVRALGEATQLEARLKKLCTSQRLPWLLDATALRHRQRKEQAKELTRWGSLGSQGKSARAFVDSTISNAWLIN
ncbi:hypothetical protein D910_07948, partial [Dendroctonus ponderosae]